MKELLLEVFTCFGQSLLGASLIKGAIDRYHEGKYYWAGFEIFGAFYIMLQMVKIVLR